MPSSDIPGNTMGGMWLTAPYQGRRITLEDEVRAIREIADQYSADHRGTPAGMNFAVLASRLDRLFGMVRSA